MLVKIVDVLPAFSLDVILMYVLCLFLMFNKLIYLFTFIKKVLYQSSVTNTGIKHTYLEADDRVYVLSLFSFLSIENKMDRDFVHIFFL